MINEDLTITITTIVIILTLTITVNYFNIDDTTKIKCNDIINKYESYVSNLKLINVYDLKWYAPNWWWLGKINIYDGCRDTERVIHEFEHQYYYEKKMCTYSDNVNHNLRCWNLEGLK